jgi:pyrroloquinoline quinone biosynthesis protein E
MEGISRETAVAQVAVSGGEPLLRPDLPAIVGDLTALGLRPVVITNGALLNESKLRRFPSGTIFEVTLFSADRGRHDRLAGATRFDLVVRNLARLRRHGQRFVLAVVLTKLNAFDLARTIKLGVALGAEGVLLNRVNLSRPTLALAGRLVPSASLLRRSLATADRMATRYGIPMAAGVPVPPCVADPDAYPHIHFGWCPRGGDGSYYAIGWDGSLRPCNHSSRVLGSLREAGFSRIVAERRSRAFWRPTPARCRFCTHHLRDVCRGGCPAASDECYGTPSRIDPFVEFACAALTPKRRASRRPDDRARPPRRARAGSTP